MATVSHASCVDQIGDVAGDVWNTLTNEGTMSLAKLARSLDSPRDIVMQAVGWLAREGKVYIEETSRGRHISLMQD